ncbi:MAG: DUF975 family protein [Kiritimatiellaeota bacterium]|nr:DUF975 family protein [Kiritimatiellota bacterium]
MEWFYERDGQPVGPVTEETLRELVCNGAVGANCRVWCAAFGQAWKRCGEVPELQAGAPPLPSAAELRPGTPNRDLMTRARERLTGNWGLAVLAGVLFVAARMGIQMAVNLFVQFPFQLLIGLTSGLGVGLSKNHESLVAISLLVFCVVLDFVFLLAMVAAVWIPTGALMFGQRLFHLNMARGANPQVNDIFAGFSKSFWRVAWAYCRTLIYAQLWSLLFVIPGIMAMLSYAMTLYILADHPELTAREAMERSTRMMRGYRWKLFCLHCRFIGWGLLCMMCTCSLGLLWLIPYHQVSIANFYESIKSRDMV